MSHTAAVWAADLVYKLLGCLTHDTATGDVAPLKPTEVVDSFKAAKKRLMLFDYDGTLTPIVKVPANALPSRKLLDALRTLCADPNNVVYIISGRDYEFLEQTLGQIPNIGLSAEHGCFLRPPGATEWTNLAEQLDMSWQHDVEDLFRCASKRGSMRLTRQTTRSGRRARGSRRSWPASSSTTATPIPSSASSRPRNARRCSRTCSRRYRSTCSSARRTSRSARCTRTRCGRGRETGLNCAGRDRQAPRLRERRRRHGLLRRR